MSVISVIAFIGFGIGTTTAIVKGLRKVGGF